MNATCAPPVRAPDHHVRILDHGPEGRLVAVLEADDQEAGLEFFLQGEVEHRLERSLALRGRTLDEVLPDPLAVPVVLHPDDQHVLHSLGEDARRGIVEIGLQCPPDLGPPERRHLVFPGAGEEFLPRRHVPEEPATE